MAEDQTGGMGSPLGYSMLIGEIENGRKTQESSAREMSNSIQNTMSSITVDFKNALRSFQDSLVRALDTLSLTMGRIDQNMVNIGTKIGTIGVSPAAPLSPSEYYEERLGTRMPTGPLGVWAGTMSPAMERLARNYNSRIATTLYRPFDVDPITYGIEAPNLYTNNISNGIISGGASAVETIGGYYATGAAVNGLTGALGMSGIATLPAQFLMYGTVATAIGAVISKTLQPFVTAAIRHNDESENLRRLSYSSGAPLSHESARDLDRNLVELGYRRSQYADLYDIKIGAQGYREIMKTAFANQMVTAEDMKDLPKYAERVGETAKLLAGFLGSKDVKEAVEQINNLRLAGIDVVRNQSEGYNMMSSLRVASMKVGMKAQDMLNASLASAAAAYGAVGLPASVGINGFMQNVTATRELERRGLLTREDIATGGGVKNIAQTQQQVQARITDSPEYKLMLASMLNMQTGKLDPNAVEGMKGQGLFGAMGRGLGNSLRYGPAGYMAIEANMQNLLAQLKDGKLEDSTRVALDKILDFQSRSLVPKDAPLWIRQGFEQKLLMDRFGIDRGAAASIIKQRYNPDLVGITNDQKDYYNKMADFNANYNRQGFGNMMRYMGDTWDKFWDRQYMRFIQRPAMDGSDWLDQKVRDYFLPNYDSLNPTRQPMWTENSQSIIDYASTHRAINPRTLRNPISFTQIQDTANLNPSMYDMDMNGIRFTDGLGDLRFGGDAQSTTLINDVNNQQAVEKFVKAGYRQGRIYEGLHSLKNFFNSDLQLRSAVSARQTNSPIMLGEFGAKLYNDDGTEFTRADFAKKWGKYIYDKDRGFNQIIDDIRDSDSANSAGPLDELSFAHRAIGAIPLIGPTLSLAIPSNGFGTAGKIGGMNNPFLDAQQGGAKLYFMDSNKVIADRDRDAFINNPNSVYNKVSPDEFFKRISDKDVRQNLIDVVKKAPTLDQAYANLSEFNKKEAREAVKTMLNQNPTLGNANSQADINRVIATLTYKLRGQKDGDIKTGEGFGKGGSITEAVMYNPEFMMEATSMVMSEKDKAAAKRMLRGGTGLLNLAPNELDKALRESYGLSADDITGIANQNGILGLRAIAEAQAKAAINSKAEGGLDLEAYNTKPTQSEFLASEAYKTSTEYQQAQRLSGKEREALETQAYNKYINGKNIFVNSLDKNNRTSDQLLSNYLGNLTDADRKQVLEDLKVIRTGKRGDKVVDPEEVAQLRGKLEKSVTNFNMQALSGIAAEKDIDAFTNILRNNGFNLDPDKVKTIKDNGGKDLYSLLRSGGTTVQAKTISNTLQTLDTRKGIDNNDVEGALNALGSVGQDLRKKMANDKYKASTVDDLLRYYQNAVTKDINTQKLKTDQASMNPKTPIDTTVTREYGDPASRVVIMKNPMTELKETSKANTTPQVEIKFDKDGYPVVNPPGGHRLPTGD